MFVVNPTFALGRLVMTRGVNDLLAEDKAFAEFVTESLNRHVKGDWGELGDEDKQENELSLKAGYRLLSAYEAQGLPKIWIITEPVKSLLICLTIRIRLALRFCLTFSTALPSFRSSFSFIL